MIRRFTILLLSFSIIQLVTLGQAPPKRLVPAIKVKPGLPPKSIPRLPVKSVITDPAKTPRPTISSDRPDEPITTRNSATPPKPKTPGDKLHAALIAVKFDRTPDGILTAVDELQKEAKPTRDKTKATADRFRLLANAGSWEELGKHIQLLPFNGSTEKAYRHLIASLLRPPITQSKTPPPISTPPIPSGSKVSIQPANKPRPMLTQEDFVEILKLAPLKPSETDLMSLGNLLRGVGQVNLTRLAEELEVGIGLFGGSQPAGRKCAAQLLRPLATKSQAKIALSFVTDGDEDWALDMRADLLHKQWSSEPSPLNLSAAWKANEKLIATIRDDNKRLDGIKRGFILVAKLPKAKANEWMSEQFRKGGPGLKLIQLVQADVHRNLRSTNYNGRSENLHSLRQIVGALLKQTGSDLARWQLPLTIAAEAWLVEAENTAKYYRATVTRNNMMSYDPVYEQQRIKAQQNSNRYKPITPATVIEHAPGSDWLAALPESRRTRAMAALAETLLKNRKINQAMDTIESLAKLNSVLAKRIADTLLGGWAQSRNPNGGAKPRMPTVGVSVYIPPRPSGTPLTRAKQKRNLRELRQILDRLANLPISPPDPRTIVTAFEGAHSFAEVYKLDDIRAVFGEPKKMPVESLATLVNSMRQRLATSWRAPQIQQQANTKRGEPQIKVEVLTGYDTLLALLDAGLAAKPDVWQLKLQQAAANFDLAEYQYGNKADLNEYVKHREAAFEGFSEAAALYTLQTSVTADKPNALVFQLWFNANLGASDLSYVTRQQIPEIGNLQKIRDAILVLPDSEGHLKAFGESVTNTSRRLTPELKPRYLRASLAVLEDHPASESAHELVQHYDDLLDEVKLVARIDGSDTIGHTAPFGLFIGLRHTSDIEREAGGFARYLVGGSSTGTPYFYPRYPGQRQAPRDDLEEHLSEKLGENFEVQSITFHDNKIQSRTVGQPGWRETPLAYVLLKARDASVDRIPELQMDLDFYDSLGPVLLPATTATQIVDARPETAPNRPVDKLELTQTLDARLAEENALLTLELHATGKGLTPSLDKLVALDIPGFEIAKTDDQGLSVARIESEAAGVNAVSEHTWLLTLKPTGDADRTLSFKFPEPTDLVAKATFKQYRDADLVEVDSELALAGLLLTPPPLWPWITGIAVLLLFGLGAWQLTRRSDVEAAAPVYSVPESCTPFAVLNLLQRIYADQPRALAASHRDQLQGTIRQMERVHFAPNAAQAKSHGNLRAIAHDWVDKVS
ncbi:MAG: hypothetical protein VX392_03315 [Verrucomicrobiota bacterium]|nr:hypothetical protein [Verrucomicrobiota bacterium]